MVFICVVQSQNSAIQNIFQTTLMYPFYYPFESPFYYTGYHPYMNDPSQAFQYLTQGVDVQGVTVKSQEVNTNYSINGCPSKSELSKPSSIPQQEIPLFHPAKCEAEPSIKIFLPNQSRQSHASKQPRGIEPEAPPKYKYTHKNFESNIINKIFSFLWSQDKSRKLVSRILNDKNKVALYFDYIKIVRKYCKRYINKEYLLNLCDFQLQHIAYRIVSKQTEKLKYFTMKEFSRTIRKMIRIYLDNICVTSILTSKKMRIDIWRQHFEKMRNIRDFLFEKISVQDYNDRISSDYKDVYLEPGNS